MNRQKQLNAKSPKTRGRETTRYDLSTPDLARLEIAIADPRSNFNFKQTKNGVLSVHITEIL